MTLEQTMAVISAIPAALSAALTFLNVKLDSDDPVSWSTATRQKPARAPSVIYFP